MSEIQSIREEGHRGAVASPAKAPEGPLDKAARRFESMVVEGMVREMWKTIPVSREEGRSAGLSLAQELYQKELSKELVAAGGFGLARQIVEDARKGLAMPKEPEGSPVRPAIVSVTV